VDVAYDVAPVDEQRPAARHPKRHVEHGAILRRVDPLPAEHRIAPHGDASFSGELEQETDSLAVDPMLREIRVDPGRLERETLHSTRIAGEEIAKVNIANRLVVTGESRPGFRVDERLRHDRRLA